MIEAILLLLVVGGILGFLLGIADTRFAVETDTRADEITNLLPGFNCGSCGYPGCSSFAEAIVNKEVEKLSLCKPSNMEARQKIKEFLVNTPNSNGDVIEVSLN